MEDVREVLLKKARGFHYSETTEEYQEVDGELKLVKRKVSKKYLPPDVTALKAAGELQGDIAAVSDEDLLALREKLIREQKSGATPSGVLQSELGKLLKKEQPLSERKPAAVLRDRNGKFAKKETE